MSGDLPVISELARTVEALIFLSPEPVGAAELAQACGTQEQEVHGALRELRAQYAPGRRGIQVREVAGGYTFSSDACAEDAARRLFARGRLARLTSAQAETLAIVTYLQPVSRPEITQIRGVSADWAVSALQERDLIEESGRSQLGATLYRTTTTFLKLFGLRSLDELPDISSFDPTPQEAAELRERLLRAGDARAGSGADAER